MSSDVMNALRARIAAGDTGTALRDRFWTMGSAGSIPPDVLDELDPTAGGLVLTGATALASGKDVRALHPDLPLLIAPTSAEDTTATSDRPFSLVDQDVLFDQTVEEALEQQRLAGADMVITPSGQIAAQDVPALKAVINNANAIHDRDVLTLIVVPSIWLLDPWLKTLCAVLRDSEHPVLLGLAHSFANPLDADGALAGYQQVAEDIGTVVGWRTDLSGIGFTALGGLGAAIGLRPSARRFSQVGLHPKSSDKRDKTPHVLLPELLRFSRTSYMHKEWYAQATPDVCVKPCCGGRFVDRFDGSTVSVAAAHVHNTARLNDLISGLGAVAAPARASWWRRRVDNAIVAHTTLGERIRREVKVPTDLDRWATLLST